MFQKSIIYLLFPALFATITPRANNDDQQNIPQNKLDLIEAGIEQVHDAFQKVSIPEIGGEIVAEAKKAINSKPSLKEYKEQNSQTDCDSIQSQD